MERLTEKAPIEFIQIFGFTTVLHLVSWQRLEWSLMDAGRYAWVQGRMQLPPKPYSRDAIKELIDIIFNTDDQEEQNAAIAFLGSWATQDVFEVAKRFAKIPSPE